MKSDEKGVKFASSYKEQFTLRGMIIGSIGVIILTISSMYVALKLGALPWPIIFVALVSMFSLKLMGNTNINEINVTHTAMSAGAMVAGGLAFTAPGIWILDPEAKVEMISLLVITIGGVILGLIFTALIRTYFVEVKELPYPMGQAAAETLLAGDEGGKKSSVLFISMGASALFTFIRDWFSGKIIPVTINLNQSMISKGVACQLWLSPMLIAVGYIIGPVFLGVWFLGAILGDFGIVIGGVNLGLFDLNEALGIKTSLGIGVMVGTGVGIIVKGILPKAKEIFGPMFFKKNRHGGIVNLRWAPLAMVFLAFLFTFVSKMGFLPSIITILGVWLATSMSAQVVGQSGINPMEVFGIIVLLAVKVTSQIGHVEAFFVAAVVAIACGLVGDVMNDFKEGYILESNPKAQWFAEVIGGIIGAIVSVFVLFIILKAYGNNAFGSGGVFVAPQAGVVAAMVGGIPNTAAFIIGLLAGLILYVINFPVMTLGLGIYLPFYLSATAFIGGVLKFIIQKLAPQWDKKGTGLIIASGLLGGEAIIGVVIALIQAVQGMSAL
ncbi:OPT/YSL family transporter [Anaerovorax odorimutans]|uniref:OPT/YSL family transporter n=1 Tax=Anaerovorax odorimutans TaxID=109327 RepID=UPI00040074ED|nr:OPT/YSL family transporter [Anaerovorax odorimutans]